MMRKIALILFLLAGYMVDAQTFSVGSTCCNYNVVNYTFTTQTVPAGYHEDQYFFDIDGDLNNDFGINSYHFHCPTIPSGPSCTGGPINSISFTLATNVEFVYGASTSSCNVSNIIQNLAPGTILNSSLNWSLTSSPNSSPRIYYYSYSWPSSTYCGVQANPFYVGFRKILSSNDTIYGWLKLDTNFPGKVIDYAYTCGTYTNAPPTSTITTSPAALCGGDSVQLNANPSGGVFSGAGVVGNYFKTKNLALGLYTVNYTLPNPSGCSTFSSTVTFTVNSASITNTQTSVCSGQSITLTAQPPGGFFMGSYVTGNVFSPPISGGSFNVTYTTSYAGCNLTTSLLFSGAPAAITNTRTTLCAGETLTLTTAQWGGYFSCPSNCMGNIFQASNTGTYYVGYYSSYFPGCMGGITLTVTPNPTINLSGAPYVKCVTDTLILNMTPTGGTILYTDNGLNGNSIICGQAGIGTHTLGYTYTDANSCSDTKTTSIVVNACVGINELTKNEISFSIFPNPNNGEFEIKGIKEETIFISNELGQLIETKHINAQNNYSVKIKDLQSGVYFVGNKFSRQKVVVIR